MAAMTWHDRRYQQEPSDVTFCQITWALVAYSAAYMQWYWDPLMHMSINICSEFILAAVVHLKFTLARILVQANLRFGWATAASINSLHQWSRADATQLLEQHSTVVELQHCTSTIIRWRWLLQIWDHNGSFFKQNWEYLNDSSKELAMLEKCSLVKC